MNPAPQFQRGDIVHEADYGVGTIVAWAYYSDMGEHIYRMQLPAAGEVIHVKEGLLSLATVPPQSGDLFVEKFEDSSLPGIWEVQRLGKNEHDEPLIVLRVLSPNHIMASAVMCLRVGTPGSIAEWIFESGDTEAVSYAPEGLWEQVWKGMIA